MSDGLVARMAAAERQEDLQAERQERERQHRAEQDFEEALMFRARQVAESEPGHSPSGEAMRPEVCGRTPREFPCWRRRNGWTSRHRRRQAEEAAQILAGC